jgi:hypothetical protein
MFEGKGMMRAALLVLFVVSTSVWGIWNPDDDPSLVFNMNFETNTDYNTIDAVSGLVGDVNHCSDPTGPWEPEPNGLFDISGDFRAAMDANDGDVNACRIVVEPSTVFDLGGIVGGDPNTAIVTIALWFGLHDGEGTFIGQIDKDEPSDFWWQFRMVGSRIDMESKYYGHIALHMRTAENLASLGITGSTWHHAAVVFDKTTRYSSKIYVDGAPVEVEIVAHDANLESGLGELETQIGGGDNVIFDDYDGLLDEIRFYRRALDDMNISLLYQHDPCSSHLEPLALLPFPNYKDVSTKTNLEWEPNPNATSQQLYFGTNPDINTADPGTYDVSIPYANGTTSTETNDNISGGAGKDLNFNTVYYWMVDSPADTDRTGPIWKFTTEPGYATPIYPKDGESGIPIEPLNLRWKGSQDAVSFDVFLSDTKSLVDNNDISVREANDITDSNLVVFDQCLPVKGTKYYWRVVTNFASDTIAGPVWSFRAASNEIIVNTSDVNVTYNEIVYDALTMTWVDTEDVVPGNVADDNVAIFDFNDTLTITDQYEIVVIPLFDKIVQEEMNDVGARVTSRPMAIHVTGDFSFGGRIDISGETIPAVPDEDYSPKARCGGYRGPINAGSDTAPREVGSYSGFDEAPDDTRILASGLSTKPVWFPNAKGLGLFGPGAGGVGPYLTGGGGGYGGIGGDSSRGWMYGDYTGGAAYGDEEVPVPFGGSAGGFGKKTTSPGGAGGGGIEICATGNITLGPSAEILAEGGNSAANAYPGGGGAGGSVRIIADGNFVNAGVISVNGGKGGNSSDKPSKCSGGGGGGRVAIWYGGTKVLGQITADGGAPGVSTGSDPGETWGEPGGDGTIFDSNGSPKKASAPTPRDGDNIVYVSGGAGTIDLKWYSGYGGTIDQVYFGTSPTPVTPLGSPVSATRGEHSVTSPALSETTYYWKVRTDNAVDSDVWSFTVVDWYCDIENKPRWDAFLYNDCIVDLEDFAYFALYWYERDHMSMGETQGMQVFMSEWLTPSGRTP